jgi:hypothetical protein
MAAAIGSLTYLYTIFRESSRDRPATVEQLIRGFVTE